MHESFKSEEAEQMVNCCRVCPYVCGREFACDLCVSKYIYLCICMEWNFCVCVCVHVLYVYTSTCVLQSIRENIIG